MENGALQGFPYYQPFIDQIKKEMPETIAEATPVIVNYGLLRFPTQNITKPVQVVGIRLHETYNVNAFRSGLNLETFYPGTTTLAPEAVPCLGVGDDGQLVLPPEFERAYQQFLKTATPEQLEEAKRQTEGSYRGPGFFYPAYYFEEGRSAPGWLDTPEPGIILGVDVGRTQPDGTYERVFPRGTRRADAACPDGPPGDAGRAGPGAPTIGFPHRRRFDDGHLRLRTRRACTSISTWRRTRCSWAPSELNGVTLSPRATQVLIRLKPKVNPKGPRTRYWHVAHVCAGAMDVPIEASLLPDVEIKTWEEKQAKFIAAVEKEKVLVTILFGIISLVAVLLVGCIFYMIVQQKTRDIGIVKSVGATFGGVASIFLLYGAAVGVVGGICGSASGAVFVYYINDVQDLLTRLNPGWQVWSPEVYSFSHIPNEVKTEDVIVIFAAAIIASMTGSLIAAIKAARIWPVEALRFEYVACAAGGVGVPQSYLLGRFACTCSRAYRSTWRRASFWP